VSHTLALERWVGSRDRIVWNGHPNSVDYKVKITKDAGGVPHQDAYIEEGIESGEGNR